MSNVSFLLGAGFSAPLSFPIGAAMNDKISSVNVNDYHMHTDEHLLPGPMPEDIPFIDCFWEATVLIIQYYLKSRRRSFDYEEFYDFLHGEAQDDSLLLEQIRTLPQIGREEEALLWQKVDSIYQQLVESFLCFASDYTYDSLREEYAGFINVVNSLSKEYVVNIHTLNHDLVVEDMADAGLFSTKLDDGFTFEDSHYLYSHYGPELEECSIAYYSGEYSSNLRLFKLHGSIDYYKALAPSEFHKQFGWLWAEERMIKCPYRFGELCWVEDGERTARMVETRPSFLTGVTYKLGRYKKEKFFAQNLEMFEKNLSETDLLIVIGYGFKDSGINERINTCLSEDAEVLVIDPYISKADVFGRYAFKNKGNIIVRNDLSVRLLNVDELLSVKR